MRGACAEGAIVKAGMSSDPRILHPRRQVADHQTALERQKWEKK